MASLISSIEIPEFSALAASAGIDKERMAAAFNDPVHLFDHISLVELNQFQESCARFASLQKELHAALEVFAAYANGWLAGRTPESVAEAE